MWWESGVVTCGFLKMHSIRRDPLCAFCAEMCEVVRAFLILSPLRIVF